MRYPACGAINEVVSPGDLAYKVEEKVVFYLRYGFGEVWLVYPNLRSIHVYRKRQPILAFDAEEELMGRGPLQGFTCLVSRFFPPIPAASTDTTST